MFTSPFQSALHVEAELLAEKFDLNIIFQGTEAKTDGKIIWLPSLPQEITEETSKVFRGFLAHEVGHCRYTDWPTLRQELKEYDKHKTKGQEETTKAKLIPFIQNIYEDPFVDSKTIKEFPGCAPNIKAQNSYSKTLLLEKELSSWDRILFTLYFKLYAEHGVDLDLDCQIFGSGANQIVDSLLSPEIDSAKNVKNTADNFRLAEDTYEKLKDLIDTAKQQEEDSQGDPENADGEEGEQKQEQGSNDSEDGEEPGELEDLLDSLDPGFKESICEPIDIDNIEDFLDKGKATSGYAELLESQSPLTTLRPFSTKYDVYEKVKSFSEKDRNIYTEIEDKARTAIDYLRKRLLGVLRAKTASHWSRNELKGRLDLQKLPRIIASKPKNIYKKRREGLKLKTAVTILVDASGSMVKEVGQVILTALTEPLSQINIPTEIISFTTRGEHIKLAEKETGKKLEDLANFYTRVDNLYFRIYKSFNEPFNKAKYRLGSYDTVDYTPLVEGIEYAGKRLWKYNRQKITRRILFVITDGVPYSRLAFKHGDLFVKLVSKDCKLLNKAGVEVCGIGLKQTWVKNIFPDSVIINDLDDLGSLATQLIKKLQTYFFGSYYERKT